MICPICLNDLEEAEELVKYNNERMCRYCASEMSDEAQYKAYLLEESLKDE